MTDVFIPSHATGDRTLRISPIQRDFVALTLWVIVTFVQFGGDELLLYPLALFYAVRSFQQRGKVLGLMVRSWPIMLFPIWCLLSPIWAEEPIVAFKMALYLVLTMLICYNAVLALSLRQIMYAILLATGSMGVLNLFLGLSSGDYAFALFSHKNRMGGNMVILWTVSTATVLDDKALRLVRLAAVGTSVLAAFMILNSESATALLLMIATGGALAVGAMLLLGGFWQLGKLLLTSLVLAALALGASVAVSFYEGDPVEQVLDSVGKDRSLTGRTVLWQYAERQIDERPLLGVGAEGFWDYSDSPLVRGIYEEFYKEPWHSFSFHNSIYEIAVHQGLIGLGFALLAVAWAIFWLMRGALVIGSIPQIFFLCTSAAVFVRSLTESEFYVPFVLFHMLVWIGAVSALRTIKADRARVFGNIAGSQRLDPPPTPMRIWVGRCRIDRAAPDGMETVPNLEAVHAIGTNYTQP